MVAGKDVGVRIILFKIYFSMFRKILNHNAIEGEDGEKKEVVVPFKKDRKKSKAE